MEIQSRLITTTYQQVFPETLFLITIKIIVVIISKAFTGCQLQAAIISAVLIVIYIVFFCLFKYFLLLMI